MIHDSNLIRKLVFVFFILFTGTLAPILAAEPDSVGKFFAEHPVDKVYLHLDKDYYAVGEVIWFKAYVLDGFSHILLPGERNVYVEMIDIRGDLVRKKVLKSTDGFAWGDFSLAEETPDGNYLIRAYTGRMRQAGEHYFFQQQIYVSNPGQKHHIRTFDLYANRLFNRRLERKRRDYQISFYPEGGAMVDGVPVRIACHATDRLGNEVSLAGEIVDGSGNIVALIDHDEKRGYVEFTPVFPRGYSARVSADGSRRSQIIPLPVVMNEGVGMRVDPNNDSLHIRLQLAGAVGEAKWDGIELTAINRGKQVVKQPVRFTEPAWDTIISFHEFDFGSLQFYLVDQSGKLIAQRLVFIPETRPATVNIDALSTDQDISEIRLAIEDHMNRALPGQFSVSVTGISDNDFLGGFSDYLLYNSDFGFANELFMNPDDQNHTCMILPATKWERYPIMDLLAGVSPAYGFDQTDGLSISGIIYNPADDKPIAGHKISLNVKSGVDELYNAVTSENGEFEFSGMQFYDLRDVDIMADRLPGGDFPRVVFSKGQDRSISFPVNFQTQKQRITSRGFPWKPAKRLRKSPYQVPTYHQPPDQYTYGTPSQTIFISESDKGSRSLVDVLVNRGVGISIFQGRLLIRGPSSLTQNTEPMYMINDSPVHPGTFYSLNISDVHKIAIYKGPKTSVFGTFGGNGVIIAYTRRGDMYGRRGYELQMAGFSNPREFSPTEHVVTFQDDPGHRPTVFWNPAMESSTDGKLRVSFSPVAGIEVYQVTVEGIDEVGGIISARIPFSLR